MSKTTKFAINVEITDELYEGLMTAISSPPPYPRWPLSSPVKQGDPQSGGEGGEKTLARDASSLAYLSPTIELPWPSKSPDVFKHDAEGLRDYQNAHAIVQLVLFGWLTEFNRVVQTSALHGSAPPR